MSLVRHSDLGVKGYDEAMALARRMAHERDERFEQLRKAEEERDKARRALWECVKLSGADTSDGIPAWPPLPEYAVQEVKRLREDYDAACDDEWERLRAERAHG